MLTLVPPSRFPHEQSLPTLQDWQLRWSSKYFAHVNWYHMPMIFPWYAHDIPMIFHDIPMISPLRFIIISILLWNPDPSTGLPCVSSLKDLGRDACDYGVSVITPPKVGKRNPRAIRCPVDGLRYEGLVGGLEHVFFHIWDNPSHWRTHIFQGG